MPLPHTLLEVATDLATDVAAKAAFAADPEGFLAERGLDDWTTEDVDTALEHVSDALPPELGAQLGEVGPDADPTEVFGLLAEVEAEPVAAELAFGEGDDPGEEPAADDEGDDGSDDLATADALVTEELDDGGEAAEPAWEEPFEEAFDDAEDVDAEADLDFGAGAEDLPDDLAD